MSNRLFVGNLAFHVTEDLLKQRMSQCGEVRSVDLILDRMSGRPRGFAFVEMATPEDMQKAISELDGKDLEGRALSVKVPAERRSGGRRVGRAGRMRGCGARGGGAGARGGRARGRRWRAGARTRRGVASGPRRARRVVGGNGRPAVYASGLTRGAALGLGAGLVFQ